MSTLKISQHSDVPAALDLVREEVEKESKRIFSAGGDALKAGNIKPAKEAIAYAEKLAEFVKKIHKLGEDWKNLEPAVGTVPGGGVWRAQRGERFARLCVGSGNTNLAKEKRSRPNVITT